MKFCTGKTASGKKSHTVAHLLPALHASADYGNLRAYEVPGFFQIACRPAYCAPGFPFTCRSKIKKTKAVQRCLSNPDHALKMPEKRILFK
jgi:hypothetical protein